MIDKHLRDEMLNLIRTLNRASKNYYNGLKEDMSDKEFDTLYDCLQQLERESGIVMPNSPTNNVGYNVTSPLTKITHEYPSLSLDKTKERDEMLKWIGDHEAVLSWKCDGLTIILTYEDGLLLNAATRGNGVIGEDVTRNAVYFNNIPMRIKDRRHIVIRGEAVISYESFEETNKRLLGDKKYKNPRNMVVGATKLLDSRKSSEFDIDFIPFDLANASELGLTNLSESLEFINSIGLSTVNWTVVNKENIVETIDQKEKDAKQLGYPTDGLVIVYNDLKLCESLGSTRKYPRYAKAFKWQDNLETTILRDVEWSVAKSGLISPVAIFDPVELEGTTVRRASVHNIAIVRELGLGIGDHIKVYKANMIIPQIYEDVEKTNNIQLPTHCPVCGSIVDRRIGANKKSEFIYCVNNYCPAKD